MEDNPTKLKAPTQCELWQKEQMTRDDMPPPETFETLQIFEDSEHFSRAVLKCKTCGQLYFYEFREEVNWEGGNDNSYQTFIPVESIKFAEELSKKNPFELLLYTPRLQIDLKKDAEEPTIKWIGK